MLKLMHVYTFASKKGDPALLLAGHTQSLHAVYMMAAAFRRVLSAITNPKVEKPEGSAEEDGGVTEAVAKKMVSSILPKDAYNLRNVWRYLCCMPSDRLEKNTVDKDQRRKQLLDERAAADRKAEEERGAGQPSASQEKDGAAAEDKDAEDCSRRSEERRSSMLAKYGYGSK